jgi:CHASE2 domain-containing sensor protein
MFRRPRIFVSYRRADAEASAGRLATLLQVQFGRERVFLDTASIPFGDDFRRVVRERIEASDVVVAVIGPQWLSARNERGRRLDQDDDPVRHELQAALAARKRIVPVLVGGAAPPVGAELPAALRGIAPLNMAPLREASFDTDFDALVDELLGRRRGTLRTEVDRLRRLVVGGIGWAALAPLGAVAIAGAAWVGVLDVFNLDTHALRLLLKAGGPRAGEPVLLVTIDAESERRLQREFGAERAADWRLDHARLVDRAAAAGATAVAFDLFFESQTPADAELARAARQAMSRTPPTRVVFGVRDRDAGAHAPRLAPALREAATWGTLCLVPRGNGAVWASPLAVVRTRDAAGNALRAARVPADTPSIALVAAVGSALRAADLERRELDFDGPLPADAVPFSSVQRQALSSPQCRTSGIGDALAVMLLRVAAPGHWRSRERALTYADALAPGGVPDRLFAGRVVMVGVTALEREGANRDVHAVRDGWTPRTVFGVELQADAATALASRAVPRLPTADRQALTSIAASLVGAVAALLLHARPLAARRLALAALTLAWVAFAWWLATLNVLTHLGYDLAALWLGYGLVRALQGLAARAAARSPA